VTISEAAASAGVNTQTLRYYERRGVLPKPPRQPSGYREYPAEAVRLVRFVKRAQSLGFSVDEAAELLKWRQGRVNRERVRASAESKLVEIDRKIAELRAMRTVLAALVRSCHGGDTPSCPIIEALEGAQRPRPLYRRSTRRGSGS
jgi:MerR family transcriptional regulator, mercuric resistance operon regulatory protein